MATSPTPQRVWRALCPNCGAPVEFRSAASASAVCGYCRSTLVRDGEALRKIGESAELFDDHSPLHLGASGRLQGTGFTLVGRLQYGYAEGSWNEWHALFDNGRSGWLSEDNGRYVLAFDASLAEALPAAGALRAGERVALAGRAWQVASVVEAQLLAAEGELPQPPQRQGRFTVVDLRNEAGEVGTLDYADPARPLWSVGRSVALSELAISGLDAAAAEKRLKARGVECPSCGSAIEVSLGTTQSVVCGQCRAVVDISKGVGGDLAHYKQNNAGDSGLEPLLPLGRSGRLKLGRLGEHSWQVVGYLERCDLPEDDEDEQTFWREYLLYNRTEGFAFLVDAEDGWSWVVPITGAPRLKGGEASHEGATYREQYTYKAKTTYVLGEFYWRVKRDQRSVNTDYIGPGGRRLNRERSDGEVTWSAGETLASDAVAKAFGLSGSAAAALRRDVTPTASGSGSGCLKPLLVLLVIILVIVLLIALAASGSDRDDCDKVRATFGESSYEYQQCRRSSSYRSSGGSYGGSGGGSWGGSHK
ncbi:DUF4178 domain-containing protein [Aquabacterium sp. A7-Y]|uniref:DUF4178 domain-containing protein n=1 Tax=Aquabacterium sp. A7-Y TaxID=1349605 RepID=UPI00223CAC5D|nr:DUF4178 domain-containing protein [Aquabacterium sp. A7-Y]MCW7540857.1 DUF4178 domain-containing protein [Aquabacterium sp. A7-Y]